MRAMCLKAFERSFGGRSTSGTTRSLCNVFFIVRPKPKRTKDPVQSRMTKKLERNSAVIALIDRQLERVNQLDSYASEREELTADAEARSFSLPADATDKILRYESHLDRQLYRAMDQLERLQRRRKGENVPPLNINLGRRN